MAPLVSALEWLWNAGTATLGGAIVLALIGYVIKSMSDRQTERRKNRLDRVNAQLHDLYGPLYAIVTMIDVSWRAFHEKFWPDRNTFFDEAHRDAQTVEQWKWWMREVATPLNESAGGVIAHHSDLLRDGDYPDCFRKFLTHIAEYRSIMPLWDRLDPSAMAVPDLTRYYFATQKYPNEFAAAVRREFLTAKREQERLINALQDRSKAAPTTD